MRSSLGALRVQGACPGLLVAPHLARGAGVVRGGRAACSTSGARARPAARRLVQTARTAAVEAPATAAPPRAAPRAEEERPDAFDWHRCWYPLATLDSLDAGAPNALQLLGRGLVAWRPPSGGEWSVLEDACPHRLAPLSEGRISDDGDLMCSYHGWTFDAAGGCASIPQIDDPKALATARASGRACVKRYPCKEMFGLLWVWGDASPGAAAEAAAAPATAAPAELVSGAWDPKTPWFIRDVPVSVDTLIENIVDPSHVQFSHHGVIGSRDAPSRTAAALDAPPTRDGGFTVSYSGPTPVDRVEFRPPGLSRWHFTDDLHMLLYAVPTRMGWSRIFMTNAGPKGSTRVRPPLPPGIPAIAKLIMAATENMPWLLHAIQHNHILDGDDYFTHKAERRLYEGGEHASWSRQYFMPSSADAGVIGWRRWMDRFGSGLPLLPKSAADLPPLMSKAEVFDRYHQHTVHCPHCKAALRRINALTAVLAAAAAVAAGAIVAAAATGAAPLLSAFCGRAAAVAAAAAAAAVGLLRFRQLYIYYEYNHAHR